MNKTVIVLGGDGFCGWPTALHLSNNGYDVIIVDNLVRRKIDVELGCESLTPIATINDRIDAWKEVSGNTIKFHCIDVAEEYQALLNLLVEKKPMAIVHFAEQRSAPFSMKTSKHKRYTINNNLNATNNLLAAVVESELDIHIVHLGTMGVYGYGTVNHEIPEGYLKVFIQDKSGEMIEKEILYPAAPGSIYHLTKVQDASMFYYYNKNDNIRITDLHQGIVWGTSTEETKMDDRLINRFDYDSDYGTVLNRFLIQAAVGHPLTIYGVGGQTRAFIHLQNTVECVRIAIESPPQKTDLVNIFNQATETFRVRDLAELVGEISGAEIRYYTNPRNEDPVNELQVRNKKFLDLGLCPITLQKGLLDEVREIANKYKDRCDKRLILPNSFWRKDIKADKVGKKAKELVN